MKSLLSYVVKKEFNILEKKAEKNSECLDFLCEPKVPKKLKKTFSLALACILTAATVLAGSTVKCLAAEHENEVWATYATSPGNTKNSNTVFMYISDKQYTWAVTSASAASGYGYVTLSGVNNTLRMVSGNQSLTQVGSKKFTISNVNTSSYMYAAFDVTMRYESYPTTFSGYIKIN